MNLHVTNKILVIFLLLLFSCDRENGTNYNLKPKTKINIKNINEIECTKYSDLYDSIKFIKLETKRESLIGRIDKILFYDNKYFILDQVQGKSVFVFDKNGKYLYRIGKNGKGPGEYDLPNDIAINVYSNNIIIYNNNNKKLLSYSLDGKFIDEIKLKYYINSFTVLNADLFAIYYDFGFDEKSNVTNSNMQIIDKKGKILKSAFKISKESGYSKGGMNFFSKNNNEVLISPGYSSSIFSISPDSCIQKYAIDFGRYTIPIDFFNRPKNNFRKDLRTSNYAYLSEYFEMPNHLIFSLIYKGKVYQCLYSKKTNILKINNVFINDMYGLMTGGKIMASSDSFIISYFEPSNIDYYKNVYNSSFTNGEKQKELLIKSLESNGTLDEGMKKIKNILTKIELNPTVNEINFISSIKASDNPVLILQKLKSF